MHWISLSKTSSYSTIKHQQKSLIKRHILTGIFFLMTQPLYNHEPKHIILLYNRSKS